MSGGWFPIDEAPQDEGAVLVGSSDGSKYGLQAIATYSGGDLTPGWYQHGRRMDPQPTHWRPLPESAPVVDPVEPAPTEPA
jgi:hypothetical protein